MPNGKRIPGLKIDHPRQLALMHGLVRFAHIAAGSTFLTQEIHPYTLEALGLSEAEYRSQLDRLYQRVADDLDRLLKAVGLNIAA